MRVVLIYCYSVPRTKKAHNYSVLYGYDNNYNNMLRYAFDCSSSCSGHVNLNSQPCLPMTVARDDNIQYNHIIIGALKSLRKTLLRSSSALHTVSRLSRRTSYNNNCTPTPSSLLFSGQTTSSPTISGQVDPDLDVECIFFAVELDSAFREHNDHFVQRLVRTFNVALLFCIFHPFFHVFFFSFLNTTIFFRSFCWS